MISGAAIKAFRRRLGLSPEAFARAVRLSGGNRRGRVHEWETEKRTAPVWIGLLMDAVHHVDGMREWLVREAATRDDEQDDDVG